MRRSSLAAAGLLMALHGAPAFPCSVDALPRMLVPANGATGVTSRRPILLVAVPLVSGSPQLAEVLGDGGLRRVSTSVTRVLYPSPVEGRVTVIPSGPLTPDASYALSWVAPRVPNVLLGTFATGPAAGTPDPLPFSATHFPYLTRSDAGTCPVDSCAIYGFGSNSLAWSGDGGQTFLAIYDHGSGATVAYGVMPDDRAWYVCRPDAQTGDLFYGFKVDSDGGSRTYDLSFLNSSGLVAVTTQTFDQSCTEADAAQCLPPGSDAGPDTGADAGSDAGPDPGPDAGADQDAGQDGGDTTPPSGGCGCGATGGGAALAALLALATALRAARRTRSGS